MNGLLRRLVRQTIGGEPPAIRPLARLPWVAPLELAEDTAGAAEHTRDGAGRAAPGERRAVLDRVRTTAALDVAGPREGSQSEPLVRATPQGPSRTTGVFRAIETAEPPPRPARTRATATVSPTGAKPRPQTSDVAARAPELPQPPRPERAVAQRPERPERPSRTEETTVDLPAPLVAAAQLAVEGPHIGVRRSEAATDLSTRASSASSHEPAEVHVHIGRIEVTAVHEAPPTREKKRAARQPMSLEAYLAKRHGRTG